jgi:hypothetical protein
MFALHGAACIWPGCGWPGIDGKGKGLHRAHLIPAPYGPNTPENTIPLCPPHHAQFDAEQRRQWRARTRA